MTQADRAPVERSEAADPATTERGAPEANRTESSSDPPGTRLSGEEVTAKLNEVYAEEPRGLDPALRRIQAKSIGPSDW